MAEAEALQRKKKVRAGHRASATRTLGQIATALDAPADLDRLPILKLTLEEKLKTLKELDAEIIGLVAEGDLEAEIQQADEYQEKIFEALVRINRTIASTATPIVTPPPADKAAERPLPTRSDDAHSRGAKVKLPKLSLPRFNGSLIRWYTFWDSYESAIHSNDTLTDVDKFNYLRSLLEGPALDAIAGLTLTAANYREAVEILQKRFGNKPLIISKHMETLLNVEAVTSDQSLKELRQLYDMTESHLRSLRSLGVEPTSYGAMLSPVLLTKLPSGLRLIVSRKISSADLSMDSLLKTFEEELVARERASNPKSSNSLPRRGHERGRHQSSALLTGSREAGAGPICCYCQKSHSPMECTAVTDANSRKQMLRANGRCYNCLRKGHIGRSCRSSSKCQRCNGRHHTSICETKTVEQTPNTQREPQVKLNPTAPSYQPVPTTNNLCSDKGEAVLLQTARAVVHNPSNPEVSIGVRLLFDSGSQRSYITEQAKAQLALEPTREQMLSIATFGSSREQTKVCTVVNVGMCLKGYSPMSLSLYVVPTICEPLTSQPIAMCIETVEPFQGLDFADYADGRSSLPIDILIGCDYYWELVTGRVCRGERGPTAIHTKLGWVLSGPTLTNSRIQCSMNLVTTHVLRADTQPQEAANLDEQLRSFWELESLGIQETEKTMYDEFASKIAFSDGRYKVALPWKEFHDALPDNYQLSLKRLHGLLRRLKQDPTVLEQYDRTIREQLDKGFIEAVNVSEPAPGRVHYLPHHGVLRTDKTTTKLRVVYDASAKSDGASLNDCLHKGPKFNQLILDILLRFRSYKIALTADVEKAFLMISIDESDRDVLRFVWVDDVNKADPEIRVFRFARVAFGVSSSPFLLNATIKYHLESFLDTHAEVVRRLLYSTYVDDIVTGADTEEAAFDLYTQSKELFRRGGFNLRKFLSNSNELQQRIDHAEGVLPSLQNDVEETYAQATLGTTHTRSVEEHKILGVPWNPISDCLIFDVTELAKLASNLQPTKRNVVSLIGKFYDPLGFLAPVTIRFKVLFQRLCRDKLEWDVNLPEGLIKEWNNLVADLGEGCPISIPRSYFQDVSSSATTITLCGFCDASIQAYAAVVYLVIRTDVGTKVQFLVSKTRVAPLQTQTVPRLELLSAFLLSKLIVSVSESLQPILPQLKVQCYTDSQVALYWIRGTNREWKPFVRNRVNEIRRHVHPSAWNHCPGVSNPADLPSRGLTTMEVAVNQLWRRGPEWLYEDALPCSGAEPGCMPEECSAELTATALRSLNLVVNESHGSISSLLSCEKFSTISKLLRVTAYVMRAVRRFKKSKDDFPTDLTPQELAHAEKLWITSAQCQLVSEKNFKEQQRQFNLFADEKGVWRCRGRLSNMEAPFAVKHPVLLPRNHPLSTLIVRGAHERVHHNGVKETLTEVRRRFWIPKGRSLVRYLIHHCVLCKRFEGGPFKSPPPPPLPVFRVKEDPAFSYTGVDFAGPLTIRTDGETKSRKVWICLFTCFVTRAVHLDIVADMSTATFLRCLKRFASRRGLPHKFISDNGKTFKAASKYIKAVCDDATVKEYLAGLGCTWLFNIERAPWWGGAFERLVKSTKRCLRKLIGRAHFSHDELLTAVTEIEAVINSRPLSYVSAEDLEEPLTPSHLLVGRRILNLPDHLGYLYGPDDEEFSVDSVQLTRRMKYLNNTLNHFWNRWRTEYLSELREAHVHSARKNLVTRGSDVSVGDIVIVHDEQLPRGLWKLGRVQELFKGRDGHCRGAIVRTVTRDRQQILMKRPIQLLYPLELKSPETDDNKSTVEDSGDSDVVSPCKEPNTLTDGENQEEEIDTSIETRRRSSRVAAQLGGRRRAALLGEDRRKACMLELNED